MILHTLLQRSLDRFKLIHIRSHQVVLYVTNRIILSKKFNSYTNSKISSTQNFGQFSLKHFCQRDFLSTIFNLVQINLFHNPLIILCVLSSYAASFFTVLRIHHLNVARCYAHEIFMKTKIYK